MDKENRELGLIDILQVLGQWMVDGVKKATDWCLFLLFFGLKRWKYLLAVAIIIVGVSVFSFRTQEKQYEAAMIVRSNAMDAAQMKSYFDSYASFLSNDLLQDEDLTLRSGLDSLQRSQINSISTHYCIDNDRDGIVDEVDAHGKMKSSDAKLDSLNLCFKVRFQDYTVLAPLQKSVLKFVSEIPLVKKKNESRLRQINSRSIFLMNEIGLLDTLQHKTYNGNDIASTLNAKGSHVLVDNRKVLVYQDKVKLLEEHELLQEELDVYSSSITVVDQFVVGTAAVNSLTSILKSNLIKGLAVTYLLLFFIFIFNKVKGQYMTEDA